MTTEEHEQVVDQQQQIQQQNDIKQDVKLEESSVKSDSSHTEANGDAVNGNAKTEDSEEQPQPQQNDEQQQEEQSGEQQQQQPSQQQQPEVQPALAAQGGREVSNKILYVGGLDKTISEEQLREIFAQHGTVDNVKVLFDKNKQNFNYAFVEFEEESNASAAFDALNNKPLQNSVININWAYQSQQAKNSSDHFNIFVGDLSTEIDDEQLRKAFSQFESLVQAHVMWDMQSGRSRGYGFVSFTNQEDAEVALATKQGEQIGNRQVRLNWASHKQHNGHNNHGNHHNHHNHHNNHHNNHRANGYNHRGHHNNHHNHHLNSYQNNGLAHPGNGFSNINTANLINGSTPITATTAPGAPGPLPITPAAAAAAAAASTGLNIVSPQSYDLVLRKTPSWLTTVYLGNLNSYTTQADLIPLVQNFGYIVDFKFHPEKNCAFVKYDSHERAALAIVQLSGFIINGRPLKSGWGKDRINNNVQYQNYGPVIYQGR